MRYHWRRHEARSPSSGIALVIAAFGAAIQCACPGVAAERLTFPSVYECTIIGHFPRKTCIDAFDDAWDVYRERVPRFRTRAECNAQFKVCVVFNAPSYGGRPPPPLKPADVTYAPPLLGVVMSQTGEALQVQVDTTRKPLVGGVPLRNAAKPDARRPGFSGGDFAPPSGAFVPRQRSIEGRYIDAPAEPGLSATAPVIDAPGATSLDGVSSFPVPENRRRKR